MTSPARRLLAGFPLALVRMGKFSPFDPEVSTTLGTNERQWFVLHR